MDLLGNPMDLLENQWGSTLVSGRHHCGWDGQRWIEREGMRFEVGIGSGREGRDGRLGVVGRGGVRLREGGEPGDVWVVLHS